MPLLRVRTVTTGLPGSPYLTTHYFDTQEGGSAATVATQVVQMWTLMRPNIQSAARMLVQGDVATINPADGQITSVETVADTEVQGNNGGALEWTAKQGVVQIDTGVFVNGRRLRGRMYIPGVAAASGEQSPVQTYVDTANIAVRGMISQDDELGQLAVWSRSNGIVKVAQSANTLRYWAILRSRRD